MAKKLGDCEFWLPSQFLTDDELLMDFKINDGRKYLGLGFNPSGTHSDLSSPVDSVIGSVDTESDEEEYITGLTHKMGQSTLRDSGFSYGNTKGWSLSGSPQSTLCGCKQGSSSSPVNQMEGAFDQFYAAAGELARIRMMDEAARVYQTNLWATAENTSAVPAATKYSNQPLLSYQKLQVAQFQRLKQQQMMKQGQGVLGSIKGEFGQYPVSKNLQQFAHSRGQNGAARPMNSSIFGWPNLQQSQFPQQHPGSGMRAVFLGNQGPKRECAGTGVFLPRTNGTQTETRQKTGCSTVLLPDRVVQALNLNLQGMDVRQQNQVQTRCYQGGSGLTPSNCSKYPNNLTVAQQKRNLRTGNIYSQPVTMTHELLLPQDWTY